MGTNIVSDIATEISKIDSFISQNDYNNSDRVYKEARKKILNLENEELIRKLTQYLLANLIEEKNKLKFQTLITNLRYNDKIPFLFQLIYENKLVDSIEIIQMKGNKIIHNKLSDEKDINKIKQEIEIKMSKIIEVNKYINLCYFRSILFEMIAEKYYRLGSINYSMFISKKEQKSKDLSEIIIEFSQCVDNYDKTYNQKIKLENYKDSLEKVKAHFNILLGFEKIKEEKFEEALKIFSAVNYNNATMIEEKNKGIHICYERLGEIEEIKGDYEKAIIYYTKINKDEKVFELNIKLNEKKIIECIKAKLYKESFDFFLTIFDSFNKAKNSEYFEIKYNSIKVILIELIVKLAIIAYREGSLEDYKLLLEQLINKINHKEIESKVDELLLELAMIKIEEEENNLFNYIKASLIDENSSEVKKRLFLSLIIINYLSKYPNDTLEILLKHSKNLSFITKESFNVLKNYFKEITTLNELFLISEIFYKIIVSSGLFNNNDCLNIIGTKIIELCRDNNIQEDPKYNDIIEYLILSYQEILITNKNVKSLNSYKNVFFNIIKKDNKFINCISRGLLFLSKNKIIFEKKILNILKTYLMKNEDANILEVVFIQFFQQEPQSQNLPENLEFIFELLINQKKNNFSRQTIDKIFNLLLTLSEGIISSKTSIFYLEKYLMEIMNINPLCYKLIKKIPIEKRGIIISQKLSNYNDKEFGNIQINSNQFKSQLNFKSIITKEELEQIENKLNDQEIVDQLIKFLKRQKELFKYLNLEKITKYFSLSMKELFNLIIENEVIFNENSMINLLNGFYRNNEIEIKETFNVFKKIRKYQKKFPDKIEINLKLEKFLNEKEYLKSNKYDQILNEMFNNISYLYGFSNQHCQFILYILDVPGNNQKNLIAQKMLYFLIEKNYDIGIDIYNKIIVEIHTNDFLIAAPNILINSKISNQIKESALLKLYELMQKDLIILRKIIMQFKTFVDWIIIPDKLLQYLLHLLKNLQNNEMLKEIIFILGNYFSLQKKKQEQFLDDIISIIQGNNAYQYIKNNIKTINKKNELFYLFACLYYIEAPLNIYDEKSLLTAPTNIIIDYIINRNQNIDKRLLLENITYLNDYWKYNAFSPKRDQILRKLFFNNKSSDINKLKLLCC